MPLHGRFELNNADYSPLHFDGIGVFIAFSGNGVYRNKGGCGAIVQQGPIPPGIYHIVDRPTGSVGNRLRSMAIDTYKSTFYYHIDHSEWFALYRADGLIDDNTWINGIERGGFRLHPGQISEGCITLPHRSDFLRLRDSLLQTDKSIIAESNIDTYGTIEVIAYGDTCP
ncbi:DUF2778 domain-containing protein [Enterobacter sp. Bisph1]|uniref:DUF2778 domain-containing protein n=1 Tax=Enterobacter sp. Bisph1 TaxID=1274399 RepID=UPI000907ABED|nr:DUF2778 domain-containing protein [Enterobacter sp. Bisph1]